MTRRAVALCACLAIAACAAGPAPMAVQPKGARGQATDFSVASRELRATYANLVPQGVAASAIRLGNDNCYYYVNGPQMAPLMPATEPKTQICL
ncbi:hypothetical protein [Pseudorhodobacter sp.]|uniref:hypothetical protein n=1 Tax=Pseudorhodobacter sp. TaxID=1934400 RepID=UPI0039E442A9